MDYHLIKASEARELAETRFRKYYSKIEDLARFGSHWSDFTLPERSNEKKEEDRRFYEELVEDFKSRGYTVNVYDEHEYEEDQWGEYIEGSDYTIHHVRVEW